MDCIICPSAPTVGVRHRLIHTHQFNHEDHGALSRCQSYSFALFNDSSTSCAPRSPDLTAPSMYLKAVSYKNMVLQTK